MHALIKTIGLTAAVLVVGAGVLYFKPEPPQITVSEPSIPQIHSNSRHTQGLVVHIAGAVQKPGVYLLPTKSRVVDLLKLVGGTTKQADISSLNLAQELRDGERIYIPFQAHYKTKKNSSTSSSFSPKAINLNTASIQDLIQLKGIGPKTAAAVLAYRTKHGNFKQLNELTKVKGIGPGVLKKLLEGNLRPVVF